MPGKLDYCAVAGAKGRVQWDYRKNDWPIPSTIIPMTPRGIHDFDRSRRQHNAGVPTLWLHPLFQSLDGVVDLVDPGQDFQHQRLFFGTGAKVFLQSLYEMMVIIDECLF